MNQANDISTKIGSHNEVLARAITDLRRTQAELEPALDARRRSLDELLVGVNSKTEAFDATMRSFQAPIEDTFHRAKSRAHDIGTFLTNSTQSISGVIGEQFEEIRLTGGKERERTAAALRAAYEQANAEMNQIFTQAVDRFKATVTEMRGMSVEIQRELETTRQELRRGAVELPRETSEQASAMRRVVGEQIKALNELTDIVARSGRAYDVSEPAPLMPRPSEPEREFPQARAGSCRRLPGSRGLSSNRPRGRAAAPRRDAAAPATAAAAPAGDRRRRRSRSAAPAGSPTSSPAPRAKSRRSSRAGRSSLCRSDGTAPPARQAGRGLESLNSITRDIARMVDHDAAADVWQRYNNGERNVFSRRLYTAQGQQTFEEIRRRYRSDTDFRRDRRPLCPRIRAPARRGRPRRSRWFADAHLSHVRNRQGLYDALARGRPVRTEPGRPTRSAG